MRNSRGLALVLGSLVLVAMVHGESWLGAAVSPAPRQMVRLPPSPPPANELNLISMNGVSRAQASKPGGSIEVWKTFSQLPPRRLHSDLGQITVAAFDYEGDWFAAGDTQGRLRLWDWRKSPRPISSHDLGEPIRGVSLGRDGAVMVRLGGKRLREWPGP